MAFEAEGLMLRFVGNKPRSSTTFPLDIPVDELVIWRQLAGDGRLAGALEACQENGWEALP